MNLIMESPSVGDYKKPNTRFGKQPHKDAASELNDENLASCDDPDPTFVSVVSAEKKKDKKLVFLSRSVL